MILFGVFWSFLGFPGLFLCEQTRASAQGFHWERVGLEKSKPEQNTTASRPMKCIDMS